MIMKKHILWCVLMSTLSLSLPTFAQTPQTETTPQQGSRNYPPLSDAEAQALLPIHSRIIRDIPFKKIDNQTLKMDIYLPNPTIQAPPVVVWVYGGAWKRGQKENILQRNNRLLNALLKEGYAVAAISYRLSHEAIFPAQIQDINDALQFLWQHGSQYNIDSQRIALAGRSAGAHLAALATTSHSHQISHFITSSPTPSFKIQAFAGFFGPYDLNTLGKNKPNRSAKASPEALLLGVSPAEHPQIATTASPIHYVNANTPPILLLHGTNDKQVPHEQSEQLKARLDTAGVPNQLHLAENAHHGDPIFDTETYVEKFIHFMRQYFPARSTNKP